MNIFKDDTIKIRHHFAVIFAPPFAMRHTNPGQLPSLPNGSTSPVSELQLCCFRPCESLTFME